MPILQVYVTDETMERLEILSVILGRKVEELAESSVEEEALHDRRADKK